MACKSCAQKAALRNAVKAKRNCTYSLTELNAKLSLAIAETNTSQILILQQAINNYSSNCNQFNSQIT